MTDRAAHQHFLVLDDNDEAGQFMAHPGANRWALLKMAKAESTGDSEKQAVAFYDLVVTIILAEERDRLDEYMMDHGDEADFERMAAAVGRFIKGETGLPLAPSPDSSSASTETSSATEVSSSEPDTAEPWDEKGEIVDLPVAWRGGQIVERRRMDLATGETTEISRVDSYLA